MTSISNLLRSNAASGVQSYQQAPSGIQGLLSQLGLSQGAQQQGGQDLSQLDPQQLSELIQNLQQNGQVSGNPTQDDVQDAISGSAGADTLVGGSGADAIANTPAQAQSGGISDMLNKLASGSGGIDYDALRSAYPTPQSALSVATPDQLDALAQAQVHQGSGESGGSALMRQSQAANALGIQQQMAQQNAMAQAQNAAAVNSYNSTAGLAEKAGTIQAEAQKNALTAALQPSEIAKNEAIAAYNNDVRGQNHGWLLDQNRTGPNGEPVLINRDTGQTKLADTPTIGSMVTKPLDAAKQGAIVKGINDLLTTKDEEGKVESVIPLDPAQKTTITALAGKLYQSGKAANAADAVDQVVNSLGGLDALQEKTTPRTGIMSMLGDKDTGTKAFPADSIAALTGNPAAATSTAPIQAASPSSSSAPNLTPAQMQSSVQSAIKQGATPADIQTIATKWNVSINPETGAVTPKGWQ